MAGFLDFLFGNLANNNSSLMTGQSNPYSDFMHNNPAIPQYFRNLSDQEQGDLLKSGMSQLPGASGAPSPQSLAQGAAPAINPENLGMKADASNPLQNESIRKQMLMQYLQKMSQSPQGQQAMNPAGLAGGMGGAGAMSMPRGGGMGSAMAGAGQGVMSMPYAPMQRPRFIGGGGMGGMY